MEALWVAAESQGRDGKGSSATRPVRGLWNKEPLSSLPSDPCVRLSSVAPQGLFSGLFTFQNSNIRQRALVSRVHE